MRAAFVLVYIFLVSTIALVAYAEHLRRRVNRRVDATLRLLAASHVHGHELLAASKRTRDELEKRTRELQVCRQIFAQHGFTLHLLWQDGAGEAKPHLHVAIVPVSDESGWTVQ